MNKKVCLLYVLAFLGVISAHASCLKFVKKGMDTPIGSVCGIEFDYWSISHFLLYVVLGITCPNQYLFFIAISIAWELYEDFHALDTKFVDCKKTDNFTQWWCNAKTNSPWIGKYEDIAVNMLGYLVGNYIHTTYRQ
jgi:hypothetical protein